MNCPNCNKKPIRIFSDFRLHGVTFKKALEGYFKCKHCGTLLKEESKNDFSKYQTTYWYFLGVYFLLLLVSLGLALYLVSTNYFSNLYILLGLLLCFAGLIGTMDYIVKPRYWLILEVEDISRDEQPDWRLTSKGWMIFIIYCVTAIALFILIPESLEVSNFSKWTVLGGAIFYNMIVIGGAVYVIIRYSTEQSEKAINE